jgi:hypothetical protein
MTTTIGSVDLTSAIVKIKSQNDLDIEILQLEVVSLQKQINALAKYLDSVFIVVKDLNAIISQKETI